jgi:intraflagellar transport protein 140
MYFMGRKVEDEEEEESDEDKKPEDQAANMIIVRKSMKDFVGLESVDEQTKEAIMNFSFYLTVGNMDEAYNSVCNIKNNNVWQNMA